MDSLLSPVIILMLLLEELSFSLNAKQAKKIIEKMVENQGWTDNHMQGTNNIQ